MKDTPLLDRLAPSSVTTLIVWTLLYAVEHPQEVTAEGLNRAWKGDAASQRAAALFTLYGLGRN